MKCEKCGGEISLEQLYCPFCGALNTEAQQHAKDMKNFKADYSKTKESVYSNAAKRTALIIKTSILAALIIASIIIASIDSYDINRHNREKSFNRDKEKVLEQIQDDLDNKDYIDVYRISEMYNYSAFRECGAVERSVNLCKEYSNVLNDFGELYDDGYRQSASQSAQNLAREMKYTIKQENGEYELYDSKTHQVIPVSDEQKEIARSIYALYQSNLKMTSEEVENLKNVSETQEAAIIEQRIIEIYGESERGY